MSQISDITIGLFFQHNHGGLGLGSQNNNNNNLKDFLRRQKLTTGQAQETEVAFSQYRE